MILLSIFSASLSTISLFTTRLYTLICDVFIALEKASRNDALTRVSATDQILDINPDLKPKYMCLDSASDSNSIYQFFQEKNIIPFIDHNKRRKSIESKTGESINSDGIPVCSCGHTMTYDGYDYTRYRKKYRCP